MIQLIVDNKFHNLNIANVDEMIEVLQNTEVVLSDSTIARWTKILNELQKAGSVKKYMIEHSLKTLEEG